MSYVWLYQKCIFVHYNWFSSTFILVKSVRTLLRETIHNGYFWL